MTAAIVKSAAIDFIGPVAALSVLHSGVVQHEVQYVTFVLVPIVTQKSLQVAAQPRSSDHRTYPSEGESSVIKYSTRRTFIISVIVAIEASLKLFLTCLAIGRLI